MLLLMGDWGAGLALMYLIALFLTIVPLLVLAARLVRQHTKRQQERNWQQRWGEDYVPPQSSEKSDWWLIIVWMLVMVWLWGALLR